MSTEGDGVINSGQDIYSYSQIIQGILIVTSALVAVAGYVVQSRLKDKEIKRKLKLERVRTQLADFVGPCSVLSNAYWLHFWRVFAGREKYQQFMGSKSDPRCFGATTNGVPLLSLNEMTNGRIQRWYDAIGFNITSLVDGSFNALESWVGPEVEQEIRSDPTSDLATFYFTNVRFLFKNYVKPQAKLFTKYGGHLVLLGESKEFKQKYPSAKGSGWLRNLFILQFINWSNEFEDVVFPLWDKNNFTYLFPPVNPYPIQLGMYLTRMITDLRSLEAKLGSADHVVHATNKDMNRAGNKKEKEQVKSQKIEESKGGPASQTGNEVLVRQRYVGNHSDPSAGGNGSV
jgi:hypothetical protein